MGETIKDKVKPLIPSLRERKRYLAFKLFSKNKLSADEVESLIKSSLKNYIGIKGLAKAGLIMLKDKFDYDKQCAVVRINNKEVDNFKAALVLTDCFKNQKIRFQSLIVSGILQKAVKKYQ